MHLFNIVSFKFHKNTSLHISAQNTSKCLFLRIYENVVFVIYPAVIRSSSWVVSLKNKHHTVFRRLKQNVISLLLRDH